MDHNAVTVLTRPQRIPVDIKTTDLDDLPTAIWVRGRSNTMKALSHWMLKPGDLLLVTGRNGARTLKQVIGTPEEQYDHVTRTVGGFANVQDPSLQAIRNNLPADVTHGRSNDRAAGPHRNFIP